MAWCLGLIVWLIVLGSWFGFWGSGFRFQGVGLRVQVCVSVHSVCFMRWGFPRVMRRNFSRESKGRNRIALRQIPLPKSVRQTPLAPDVAGTNAPGLVTRLVKILHGLVNRIGRHWRSFSRVQGFWLRRKRPPPCDSHRSLGIVLL